MSTTFDARDGNAPDAGSSAVALADEETLRRFFLEEYPALTEEAKADLGPDARALVSKVVEGAFVRASSVRAGYSSRKKRRSVSSSARAMAGDPASGALPSRASNVVDM